MLAEKDEKRAKCRCHCHEYVAQPGTPDPVSTRPASSSRPGRLGGVPGASSRGRGVGARKRYKPEGRGEHARTSGSIVSSCGRPNWRREGHPVRGHSSPAVGRLFLCSLSQATDALAREGCPEGGKAHLRSVSVPRSSHPAAVAPQRIPSAPSRTAPFPHRQCSADHQLSALP